MNESENTLRRYLLGELPEAEQTVLERKYFSDPRLFERLVEIECRLVDQHARGQLSAATRERFENYYLAHHDRRERARFAAALATKLGQVDEIMAPSAKATESWFAGLLAPLRSPRFAWGFSFAILLLIAAVAWFAMERRRLHQELARNEVERAAEEQKERDRQQQLAGERTRADQLTSELNRMRAEQQAARPSPTPHNQLAPAVATLIFTINGSRGGESGPPAKLVIPPGTDRAQLQLNLKDNDYRSYAVVIQSAGGTQVFKHDGLQSKNTGRASLAVIVPASKFSNGDYILTLKGVTQGGEVEDVSKSLFRVEKH